jgi:hypothetical protein
MTMTFEELLDAANSGEHTRLLGQWTPTACRVWREPEPDDARLLEAALALELTTGRRVQAYEEAEVRERRRAMDEATAAMKANAAG